MAGRLVAACALSLACATACAAEIAGVRLDDRVSVGGKDLVLNGAGIRTRAIFKVYVGSLYLPQKAATPLAVMELAPRRVQLNLLRDLTAQQFVDALMEGMQDNNPPEDLRAIKPQMDELVRIMQAIGQAKEGSIIALDYVDGGTRITQDGAPRGTIPGEAFNKALFRIWLGDRPAQADLKKAMLGGS
ncbi:MAG TPA: chalcone isomerase family protein [Casimicrobiaceae bacterium]|jgi:long-chain acyl-CoA synthetase